jgi:hypothetical protein
MNGDDYPDINCFPSSMDSENSFLLHDPTALYEITVSYCKPILMSAPTRSAYSGAPPSGPGIFLSLSKIIKHEVLSDEVFNKWYNEVHLPDVLATGKITRAYRFRNKNPDAERPYLALYICPDMSCIAGEEVKSIPMHSNLLPQGKSIHELANFDTRFYNTTQEFVKEKLEQQGVDSKIGR